jgi:RNA polymerase sigma factor (sigma-70 family)
MRNNPLGAVVRHLRMRAGRAAEASSPDALLLTRFARHRDETAFEEIVRRHGPLVWALCRGGLQTADAEDAFQATFVVLARRAGHIRKPASLACWLSGVTRRVVGAARKQSARQPLNLSTEVSADAATGERDRSEWREVLSLEMDRLPEKYRLPTLLCYYQGLTNEEAAARLGWPHGTVTGRLARAREMLRRGLARKGLTLSAGALTVGAAGPPSELIGATFRTCTELMGAKSAEGTVAGSVLQLAEGAMHAIWLEKVRIWAIGAMALTVLGGTAGWALVPAKAQPGQQLPPAAVQEKVQPDLPASAIPPLVFTAEGIRLKPDALEPSTPLANAMPTDNESQKLIKKRYHFAHYELLARLQAFGAGTTQGTIDVLLGCITHRLLPAELALSNRLGDKLNAYERSLVILKWIEAVEEIRFRAGRVPVQDLEQICVERLSAEIKLLEMKQAKPPTE